MKQHEAAALSAERQRVVWVAVLASMDGVFCGLACVCCVVGVL